jgi:RNA polymerase sigma-70 factor (ECF subfamily)
MTTAQPDSRALLEHADFLRALARSLLRDAHEAEDVVQEAYLAALRRGPRALREPRAWLAGAVRNLARMRRRGEGRRRARERIAAKPEAAATDAADAVARLEIQRTVVDAVLGLDEAYRTVLVLRFFHGLGVNEIAARHGVPPATVRTRQQRALEQLRGRLDRAHGGDRRAWALALVPLLARRSLAVPLVAAAAIVAVVGAGALFALRGTDETAPPRRVAHGGGPAADVPGDGAEKPAPAGDENGPDAPAATAPATCALTVVARDDGAPAAGVHVAAGGALFETDARGRVELPRPGKWVKVFFRGRGFLRTNRGLDPGTETLCVELERGIPVDGRVVVNGAGLAGAEVAAVETGSGRELDLTVTDDAGRFEIVAVRPGLTFEVGARAPGLFPVRVTARRTRTGAPPLRLELGTGGVVTGKVTGAAAGAGVFVARAEDAALIHAPELDEISPRGRENTAFARLDADGRFEVRGLPLPGRYVVVAEAGDRRLRSEPVAVTAAQPRAAVRLDAAEATGLVVRVVDGEGRPVRGAVVSVHDARGNFVGIPMRRTGADGAAGFRPPGAGAYGITVSGPGWRTTRREVEIGPGATASVTITPDAGLTIEGRVVDGDGRPAAGLKLFFAGTKPDGKRQFSHAVTNDEGAFALAGLDEGRGLIDVLDPAGRYAGLVVRDVVPGADPLALEVGPAPVVTGRVVDAPGRLSLVVQHERPAAPDMFTHAETWLDVDGDGRFRAPAVPAGRHVRLVLRGEGVAPILWVHGALAPGQKVDLGDLRLDEGATLTGIVVDAESNPIRAAQAVLRCDSHLVYEEHFTDSRGRFAVRHLPAAPGTLTLEAEGFLARTVTLGDVGAASGAPFVLTRYGVLVIENGAEMLVRGRCPGQRGDSWWDEAEETEDGGLAVRLPPGTWTLRFATDPDAAWRDGPTVDVEAGATTRVRLE